jgi:hypothetical protein
MKNVQINIVFRSGPFRSKYTQRKCDTMLKTNNHIITIKVPIIYIIIRLRYFLTFFRIYVTLTQIIKYRKRIKFFHIFYILYYLLFFILKVNEERNV